MYHRSTGVPRRDPQAASGLVRDRSPKRAAQDARRMRASRSRVLTRAGEPSRRVSTAHRTGGAQRRPSTPDHRLELVRLPVLDVETRQPVRVRAVQRRARGRCVQRHRDSPPPGPGREPGRRPPTCCRRGRRSSSPAGPGSLSRSSTEPTTSCSCSRGRWSSELQVRTGVCAELDVLEPGQRRDVVSSSSCARRRAARARQLARRPASTVASSSSGGSGRSRRCRKRSDARQASGVSRASHSVRPAIVTSTPVGLS